MMHQEIRLYSHQGKPDDFVDTNASFHFLELRLQIEQSAEIIPASIFI